MIVPHGKVPDVTAARPNTSIEHTAESAPQPIHRYAMRSSFVF